MPELMAWADIAIAGGGATTWELAFMGLPSLILVLADNQRPIAEWLDRQHVAIRLNRREELSQEIAQALQQSLVPDMRVRMSQRGRKIIDGQGCQRVLERLRGLELTLRRAAWADCKLLWEWANDTETREASFSSEAIPWEEHIEWFKQRIDDPRCIIYIASNSQDVPVGQVRYETEDTQAVISISLDRRFRNQGYGSLLIKKSSEDVFSATNVQTIHAYVKSNNEASARAFVKAGFQPMETKTIKGYQALRLALSNQKKDASPW
jgi:RimJ/RimL family protein N-acetyltransferase